MSIWDAKAPSWANPQILDRGKRQRRDARSALPTDYLLLTNLSLERLTDEIRLPNLNWACFRSRGNIGTAFCVYITRLFCLPRLAVLAFDSRWALNLRGGCYA